MAIFKYNNKTVNQAYWGANNFPKAIYDGNAYKLRYVEHNDTKYLAKLTLNDGSVVDIEDDGTGVLSSRMTSAYSATCISAEILSACTELDRTFGNFHYLTGVTIPNSVTVLGDNTFLGTKLVDVVVPDSVTTIGGGSFAKISTLRTITFGSGCTSIGRAMTQESKQIKIVFKSPQNPISDYDFWFYSGARNGVIEYPCDGTGYDVMMTNFKKKTSNVGSYGTVGTWTAQCKSTLSYLMLNDGSMVNVESTGSTLTYDMINPYKHEIVSVNIGNGCTEIGEFAFAMCENLSNVTNGDNVETIGNNAFGECSGLTSVTIGNSVTSIGEGAFLSCSGLTSITIPDSVTSIDNYVFQECAGLTEITIPSGVTSIGNSAFQECHGLTEITIPSGVTLIGTEAFSHCDSLTSITVEATTPPTLDDFLPPFEDTNDCPIYVPAEFVDDYKWAEVWSGRYQSRIQPIP